MLRPRGMGIMDFIAKTGSDLITPPQASPVFQGQTPLQQSMGRPQVQFSQPSAATMATTMPSGMMTIASPTPQVQQQFAPRSTGMPTPPQVSPRIGGTDMGGAGVRMTQEQLAEQAAKAVKIEQERPEVAAQPGFQNTVKEFFGDRENMLQLALAFNTMRMRPDTGLASVIGSELQEIRETRAGETQRSRTAEYFESQGRSDLAGLIEMGAIDAKQAFELSKGAEGQVVTAEQLRQQFPGEEIQDGLYNIKPNGNITKVGGGGVNVSVGGPEAIQPGLEQAGKTIFEQDIEGANQASTALRNIAKTDEVLKLLDEGEPVTGLTAPIQDVVNNARAMLGDEEAIRQASDTGLLNALLGQEVFGSITALGIGARGLDTPAEREFLREVMAGTISMNEKTIRKIAELRRKYATEVIRRYNDKVKAGDYDLLNQNFNNRYQAIDVPEKPQLQIPPVPPAFQGNADDWPEIYRNMDPQDRALFAN